MAKLTVNGQSQVTHAHTHTHIHSCNENENNDNYELLLAGAVIGVVFVVDEQANLLYVILRHKFEYNKVSFCFLLFFVAMIVVVVKCNNSIKINERYIKKIVKKITDVIFVVAFIRVVIYKSIIISNRYVFFFIRRELRPRREKEKVTETTNLIPSPRRKKNIFFPTFYYYFIFNFLFF